MSGTAIFQSGTLATPGPGIVVHADNISGTIAQMIKIDIGPAGTSVLASYAAGTGLPVQDVRSYAPTTSSVAATIGNTILLAANANRLGAAFYLDGGSALFLKLGSLAGTLDYTVQLTSAFGYYELPFHYTGTVSGIWQFAGGTVHVTEVS